MTLSLLLLGDILENSSNLFLNFLMPSGKATPARQGGGVPLYVTEQLESMELCLSRGMKEESRAYR